MGKALLLTVLFVPVLVGLLAARSRRGGLSLFLALLLAFDFFYVLILYVLNRRWT